MLGKLVLAAPLVGLALGAVSCGRSELDPGFGTTSVMTGAAGNVDSTGSGGAGGATAPRGSGGATGRAAGPTPIPCGDATCTPGAQICCVQGNRRRQTETCISAQATCDSGASIGCLTSASCGAGQVCCESLLSPVTMCVTAQACGVQPGVILCQASADCPASARNCCQADGAGICSALACPASGDQQGPDGEGVGGPQD